MSYQTYDAIREDYGDDVELPTKKTTLILWHYAAVLRTLKEAKRDLPKDSYKDLVDTLESELQRRAKLVERLPDTSRDLGDIVREEMERREREDNPLSRERLEANGWDYVTTVDTKNPDWKIVLKKHMQNMPELSGLPPTTILYDDSMSISQNERRLYEAEMERLVMEPPTFLEKIKDLLSALNPLK
jgi:hypothetical protein